MRIRDATPDDLAVVVDQNARLAEESEGLVLDRATLERGVRAALADRSKARYLLAERDGVVVGQLMLTREWSDWRDGHWWWIQSVYVAQAARRTGVVDALFDHVRALAAADAERVVGVRLYVERENEWARRTYARLGLAEGHYLLYERSY